MTAVDVETHTFVTNKPSSRIFPYTHVYRECNDRDLYLLWDSHLKRWGYFNDSTDTVYHVHARFVLGEDHERHVRELGHSREVSPSLAQAAACAEPMMFVALIIEPMQCEPFIEYDTIADVSQCIRELNEEPAPCDVAQLQYNGGVCPGTSMTVRGPDKRVMPTTTRVYRCFKEKRGRDLYRLIDDATGTWAFYNDTTNFRMQVAFAFLSSIGTVVPLGSTQSMPPSAFVLDRLSGSNASGTTGDDFQQRRSNDLGSHLKVTPSFIRGDADRQAQHSIFDKWSEDGEHTTARVVSPILDHEMRHNEKGGGDMASDAVVCELTVEPLTTALFITGTPSHFLASYIADPVHNEEPTFEKLRFVGPGPDEKVISYDKLFPCFKQRGNGLLFRLVDSEKPKWAFYNDTWCQEFTVTATFARPSASSFVPGEQVRVKEECDPVGGEQSLEVVSLTLKVPPQTTRVLMSGWVPSDYELEYVDVVQKQSEVASRSRDRSTIMNIRDTDLLPIDYTIAPFTLGGPSKSVFPFTKALTWSTVAPEMHTSPLLLLVDERRNEWAFYNDARGVDIFVEAKFVNATDVFLNDMEPAVEALGKTTLSRLTRSKVMRNRKGAQQQLLLSVEESGVLLPAQPTLSTNAYLRRARAQNSLASDSNLANNSSITRRRRRSTADMSVSAISACASPISASYYAVASVMVGPGKTEPFVRATRPDALEQYMLTCRKERAPDEDVTFIHALDLDDAMKELKFSYKKVYKVFPNESNGLVFRLVDAQEPPAVQEMNEEEQLAHLMQQSVRWAFFNDTDDMCFRVTVRLDTKSTIAPLGCATMTREPRQNLAPQTTFSTAASPYITPSFLNSSMQDCETSLNSPWQKNYNSNNTRSHPADCMTDRKASGEASGTVSPIEDDGYESSCLGGEEMDDSSNVDLDFANMTMRINEAARNASGEELVVTAVIDPLTLGMFMEGTIVGTTTTLIRADAKRENDRIAFENGDPIIFQSEEEYRLYDRERDQEHARGDTRGYVEDKLGQPYLRFYRVSSIKNGTLFRIVNDRNNFWSFHNDTAVCAFCVQVAFTDESKVQPLGHTVDITSVERERLVIARSTRRKTNKRPSASRARVAQQHSTEASPQAAQRRLSASRASVAGTSSCHNAWESPSSNHVELEEETGNHRTNFFDDPAFEQDPSARVFEVTVPPLSTELFAFGEDVVHYHILSYVMPAAQ